MQAREPSADKRGSAKRRSPRASFRGSAGGGGGTGVIGSCSAGGCSLGIGGSGAAAVVAVMTRSNARHLPALRRRKCERVDAASIRLFKAPVMRPQVHPATAATDRRNFAWMPRRKLRRLAYRQLQCPTSFILDLAAGNADVLQCAVVDRLLAARIRRISRSRSILDHSSSAMASLGH